MGQLRHRNKAPQTGAETTGMSFLSVPEAEVLDQGVGRVGSSDGGSPWLVDGVSLPPRRPRAFTWPPPFPCVCPKLLLP